MPNVYAPFDFDDYTVDDLTDEQLEQLVRIERKVAEAQAGLAALEARLDELQAGG